MRVPTLAEELDQAEAAMSSLIQQADTEITGTLDYVRGLGDKITCDSCTEPGCCYQPTLVFLFEAIYIARRHPVPAEHRASMIQLGWKMENTERAEYFESAEPCIYLGTDNRCQIYAARPAACRRYHVISPSALCQPRAGSGHRVSVVNFIRLDDLWIRKMIAAQSRFGINLPTIAFGSLPRMVAIAAEAIEQPNLSAFQKFLAKQNWLDLNGSMAKAEGFV